MTPRRSWLAATLLVLATQASCGGDPAGNGARTTGGVGATLPAESAAASEGNTSPSGPGPGAVPDPKESVSLPAAVRSAQTTAASAFRYGERTRTQTPDPAWLAAAREDPDPNVRLHALGAWAQHPGESLDPVTYALVDPDESVRARAQEVLEQELVRR